MLNIIFDIAVIAILWFYVIRGVKKGLVKSVLELLKGVVSFVAAFMFYPQVAKYISEFKIVKNIIASMEASISKSIISATEETVVFPKWVENIVTNGAESTGAVLSDKISDIALSVIAIVLIYVAVRVLFMIFNFLFDKIRIFKIGELNALGGACFGFVNAAILIYVAMLVIFLFASSDGGELNSVMQSTYVAKLFYNNNLITKLFF